MIVETGPLPLTFYWVAQDAGGRYVAAGRAGAYHSFGMTYKLRLARWYKTLADCQAWCAEHPGFVPSCHVYSYLY